MILFCSSSPALQEIVLQVMGDDLQFTPDWDVFTERYPFAACAIVAIDGLDGGTEFERLAALTVGEELTPIVLVIRDDFRDLTAVGRVKVARIVQCSWVALQLRSAVGSLCGHHSRRGIFVSPGRGEIVSTTARGQLATAISTLRQIDRADRELLITLLRSEPPPKTTAEWAEAAFCSESRVEYQLRKRLIPRGLGAALLINVNLLLAALDEYPEARKWSQLVAIVGVEDRRLRNAWRRLGGGDGSDSPPTAREVVAAVFRSLSTGAVAEWTGRDREGEC